MTLVQEVRHDLFTRTRDHDSAVGKIVYIHGLGESGLCFERLMDDPRVDHWIHICPDLPGYGKSRWSTEPLTLEQQAHTVGRWLECAATDPVVVVGHSMGGVVGLLLCEQHPGLVRKFVNVEGNISLDDCGFSSRAAGFSRSDFLAHGMARLLAAIHAESIRQRAMRDYFVSARICDPRAYHTNASELVTLSTEEGLAARLADLDLPVIYVLGEPDGTGARSRALLQTAGVRCRAIPNAGHWPFVDGQDAFVDVLLRFLEEPD